MVQRYFHDPESFTVAQVLGPACLDMLRFQTGPVATSKVHFACPKLVNGSLVTGLACISYTRNTLFGKHELVLSFAAGLVLLHLPLHYHDCCCAR